MRNPREELSGLSRRLSNGMEVVHENVEESDNAISFEFIFTEPLGGITLSDLSDLYTPKSGNDIIVQKLTNKGWLLKDATVLRHFKMDVLRDDEKRKIKFRYYLVDSSEKAN